MGRRGWTVLVAAWIGMSLLVPAAHGEIEWVTDLTLPTNDLYGAWGADPSDVHAVGDKGIGLHWDGSDWTVMETGARVRLSRVWGLSSGQVWAVGDEGTVLRWDGARWTALPPPPVAVRLNALWGSSETDLTLVGEEGTILHWNGSDWTLVSHAEGVSLTGIAGLAPDDLFLIGHADGQAFYLRGDGATWWEVPGPALSEDTGVIWTSGNEDGLFALTLDRFLRWNGMAWEEIGLPPDPVHQPLDIGGAAPDDLWIGCREGRVLHWDGQGFAQYDMAFRQTEDPRRDDIRAVWFDPTGFGIGTGAYGDIFRWEQGSWLPPPPHRATAGIREITGTGSDQAILVGSEWAGNAFLAEYDGKGWMLDESGIVRGNLNAAWLDEDGRAMAAGDEVVQRRGGVWSPMSLAEPVSSPFYSLWSWSESSALMGHNPDGSENPLWSWDGSLWSRQADFPFTSGMIRDIWAAGPDDVYVAHSTSVIHWDGLVWTEVWQAQLFFQAVMDVWGSGPDDVFAVTRHGSIAHYDGTSWSEMNAPTQGDLNALWGTGPDNVYAVGQSGTLLHYDGQLWMDTWCPASQDLYAIWGSSTQDVHLAGAYGTMLHMDAPINPTHEVGCQLLLNQEVYQGGDRFRLVMEGWNYGSADTVAAQWVLMDMGGGLYLYGSRPDQQPWDEPWPIWSEEPDPPSIPLGAGQTFADTILDFIWPEESGQGQGPRIWAALVGNQKGELLGEPVWVDFEYR